MNTYIIISACIWHNHCDICITMQYGSSLLQHWSSLCRVTGKYTVIMYADQRSSAGLVQIIYIIYNARHRITIENKTGCCGPVVRGGYYNMNRKYITYSQCDDDDDIDEGGCLSESACSADDPRSKVGMQCEVLQFIRSFAGIT